MNDPLLEASDPETITSSYLIIEDYTPFCLLPLTELTLQLLGKQEVAGHSPALPRAT